MALFSCSTCAFSSNSALRQRMHNRGHSAASCRRCRRRFASDHGLLLHRKLGRCAQKAVLSTDNKIRKAREGSQIGNESEHGSWQTGDVESASEGSPAATESASALPALRCPKCPRIFETVRKFTKHVHLSRSCGSRAEWFKCSRCDAGFALPNHLRLHLASAKGCQRRLRAAQLREALQTPRPASPASLAMTKGTSNSTSNQQNHDKRTKELRCSKCSKTFAAKHSFIDHITRSKSCGSRSGQYKCSKCDAAFGVPKALRQHLASGRTCKRVQRRAEILARLAEAKGRGGEANSCPQCQRTYSSWQKLQSHMRVSRTCGDMTTRHKCTRCSAAFPTPNELRLHMQSEKACRRRARRAEILREAIERDSDGNFACLRCAALFANESLLLDHLTSRRRCSDKATAFVCGRCGYGFGSLYELGSHRRSGVTCEVNRKRTAVLEDVTAVTGELRCLRCQLLLPSATHISVHMSARGSCPSKAAFVVCPTCRAPAPGLMELAAHRRTGEACRIRLRQQSLSTRLPIVHEEAKDLPCLSCATKFKQKGYLVTHLRTSRSCGDRAEACVCDDCGASFAQPSQLANHRRTGKACRIRLRQQSLRARLPGGPVAAGEFPCPSCGAKFSKRDYLTTHLRASRSCGDLAEACVCDDCGAPFAQPSQLSKHRRTGKACQIRLRQREILQSQPTGRNSAGQHRCLTCEATFKYTVDLERHARSGKACAIRLRRGEILSTIGPKKVGRNSSPPLEPNQLSCSKCREAFKNRGLLLKHLSASRSCGDRSERYPCPGCGSAFPFLSALAKHQRGPIACRRQMEAREKAGEGEEVKEPPQRATKGIALLRCSACAYTATSAYIMGQHRSRPKACRVQSSRVQSLCASMASSSCPNCGEEQGEPRALMEHLAHGSECVKMRNFDEPVIPALERRLGIESSKTKA